MSFGSSKSRSTQYYPGARKLFDATIRQLGFPLMQESFGEAMSANTTGLARDALGRILTGEYRRQTLGDIETLARNASERFAEAAHLGRATALSDANQSGMLWSTARMESQNALARQVANDFNRFLSDLLAQRTPDIARVEMAAAQMAPELEDPRFRRFLDLLRVFAGAGQQKSSQSSISLPFSATKAL